MTRFTVHTLTSAPPDARPALQQVEKAVGFVANLYATFADAPAVLDAYLAASAALGKGTLTPKEQELLHLAISVENRCEYCVAAHSTLADLKRIDARTVDAVRAGRTLDDPRLDVLVTLAAEAVRHRGLVSDATVAAFFAAGYSKAALLEVIGHIGLKTIANYINVLGSTPLDEAFQPRVWNAPALRVA